MDIVFHIITIRAAQASLFKLYRRIRDLRRHVQIFKHIIRCQVHDLIIVIDFTVIALYPPLQIVGCFKFNPVPPVNTDGSKNFSRLRYYRYGTVAVGVRRPWKGMQITYVILVCVMLM
jgi:hypothetical protein